MNSSWCVLFKSVCFSLQLSISLRFVGATTSLNENDPNMVSVQSYVVPWIWYVFELVKSLLFMAFPCFWSNLGWFGWGSRRSGHKGMHAVLSVMYDRSFSNSWIVHIEKNLTKEMLKFTPWHPIYFRAYREISSVQREQALYESQRRPSKLSLLARTPTRKLASNHNKRVRVWPKIPARTQTVNAM